MHDEGAASLGVLDAGTNIRPSALANDGDGIAVFIVIDPVGIPPELYGDLRLACLPEPQVQDQLAKPGMGKLATRPATLLSAAPSSILQASLPAISNPEVRPGW